MVGTAPLVSPEPELKLACVCAAAVDAYQRGQVLNNSSIKEEPWLQALIILVGHLPAEVRARR